MDKFEAGEICDIWHKDGMWLECEIICIPGEIPSGYTKKAPGYVVNVPGYPSSKTNGYWATDKKYLRKKKPPQESKDIRDTREKGAPSFDNMMDDLMRKPVRVEE